MLPEYSPEDTVRAAAAAGFSAAGIWYDRDTWSASRGADVESALRDTGLVALDFEVVWLQPGEPDDLHDAAVATALELGARNLLSISSEPDVAVTQRRFERLCRRAEGGDLRIVLEFMGFTEVKSLREALRVVEGVGHPAGGVLVDSLHLQRTGGRPDDLATIERHLLPYLQLCDATLEPPASGPEQLLDEALWLRALPGEGELPLAEVLDSVDPEVPVSFEVRSRALAERFPGDPVARARAVFDAAATLPL